MRGLVNSPRMVPRRGVPGSLCAGEGTTLRAVGLAIARSAVYNVCMPVRAMQEATFMILTALANGSQHGYGIIIDVQEISGGRVRLRRYYRLTPAGTRRLAAEAARLQAAAAAALTRLNLAGGTAT